MARLGTSRVNTVRVKSPEIRLEVQEGARRCRNQLPAKENAKVLGALDREVATPVRKTCTLRI